MPTIDDDKTIAKTPAARKNPRGAVPGALTEWAPMPRSVVIADGNRLLLSTIASYRQQGRKVLFKMADGRVEVHECESETKAERVLKAVDELVGVRVL